MEKEFLSENGEFASLLRAVVRVDGAGSTVSLLQPGDVLHKRFVIEARLGSGGMGVVYRAYDREHATTLAVKTLRTSDAAGLLRFKREFRSLADVVHPNIVLLHELVRDEDLWFFTMELVDGVPFGPRAALRPAFAQLVDGVMAVHASGRIHRDLKPSNVLVTPAGRVVILDFGLVADADPADAERGMTGACGTPAYMAPEQIAGRSAGPATDWFAAGAMLFERLTGHLPWGGSPETMLVRRRLDRALRPSTQASDVPADLDELCWRMMALDPRERPSGAEILECLRGNRESLGSTPPTRLDRPELFVGRDDEGRALRSIFDATATDPRVVHLRGPPGIGKSALARRFVTALAADGHLVFRTRCHVRESVPFAALDALVDQLAREWRDGANESLPHDEAMALRRAFPVLATIDADSRGAPSHPGVNDELRLRQVAAQGLRRLFRTTSRDLPFILWVDDFQWADADSARLLGEILAPPGAPKMVLLLTTPETLSARLMDEVTSGGRVECTTVDLGPLSATATLEMARALLEPNAGGRADEIVAEASGHPFFLEVLARSESESPPGDSAPPGSLDSAIRLRIEHLQPELRQLLTAVAVAGQPIPLAVAARAAHSSAESASIRALCAQSFLRVGAGQVVEPYHDRIRDVLYEALEPSKKATWHGSLAAALEVHGTAGPELLAHHFFLAGMSVPARSYAIQAAERASHALAFDRAADLFSLARRAGAEGEPPVPELSRLHAEALFNARRWREAAEVFLEISREAGGSELSAHFEGRAATSYFIAGHVRLGLAVLEPMLERAGIDVPREGDALRATIMMGTMRLIERGFDFQLRGAGPIHDRSLARLDLLRTAAEAWSSLDPPRATAFLLEAAPLALDTGEPHRIAWALCQVGLFFASLADEDMQARGATLLASAAEMVERWQPTSMRGAVELGRGRAALSVGRFREGVRLAELCLMRAERAGVGPQVVEVAQTVRLYGLLACGDLALLADLLPALLADAERRADAYWLVTVRLYVAHLRLLTAGDADGAAALVEAALSDWGERRMLFQTWLGLRTRVLCELYAGRAERASSMLRQAWPDLEGSGLLALGVVRPEALRLNGITALAHRHPGTVEEVEQVCASLSERRPDEAAARLTFGAALLVERGQRDEALTLLRHARATHRRAGQRLDAWVIDAARRSISGMDVAPAARRLRKAGVRDPWRWVTTLAPFARGEAG